VFAIFFILRLFVIWNSPIFEIHCTFNYSTFCLTELFVSMEPVDENRKIEIDHETLNHLNTARKWSMFIAVLGLIFLGLIIIIGAIAGTFFTAFSTDGTVRGLPESLLLALTLAMAVAYLLPVVLLFRFSKYTGIAVKSLKTEDLRKGIKSLKSFFLYIGILIILMLAFYAAALIITGTSLAFY
jgi:hypothetical protein